MKSLLNKAAVAASVVILSMSSANAVALDNEIYISGTVTSKLTVGFVDVSGLTNSALFVGADIALGAIAAGGQFTASSNPIFVNTNTAGGVAMTITDGAGLAGALVDQAAVGANIAVAYTLNGAAYTVGVTGAVTITTGANLGSTALANPFVATPAITPGTQAVGTYATTLDVVVAAL